MKSGSQGTDLAIATDEVSGTLEHIQLFKLAGATDGSRVLVPADAAGLRIRRYSSAGTRTQVADTTTETVLLAANSWRVGASVYNDSTATLYLGEGTATVTSSNYTAQVPFGGFYETPDGFTGQLRGVWATDPGNGGAKITERT